MRNLDVEVKVCSVNLGTAVMRYYLLMALVLIGGFTGLWWIALLALPVFLSALLGLSFNWKKPEEKVNNAKVFKMDNTPRQRKIS